jgi:hypothetical protein
MNGLIPIVFNCWQIDDDISWFKDKILFNKINKGIGIMHMEEAFAPKEYGMEMINHKYLIFYRKYVFSLLLSILVKLFLFGTKLHLLVFLFMHLFNFFTGIVYGTCLLYAIGTMQWQHL